MNRSKQARGWRRGESSRVGLARWTRRRGSAVPSQLCDKLRRGVPFHRAVPSPARVLRLAFLLLLASTASAQPSGGDLLADWRRGWASAARDVEAVVMQETLDRTVDGPRSDIEMRTEATLTYARRGQPQREVERTELNGRRAGRVARRRFESRADRAFGAGAALLRRPPPLPATFLADADALTDASRDRVDGRPAWRIRARVPSVRTDLTLWFSRDDRPELLRIRTEPDLPRDARAVLEADYRRVDGLDVPATLRTTITLRQRRRLREYVVSLRARGTYRAPEFVRTEQ